MKFGRLLRTTAADLPEMQDLCLHYKQLKKQLKDIPTRKEQLKEQGSLTKDFGMLQGETQVQEHIFTLALTTRLQQLNESFMEREETKIIQLQRFADQVTELPDSANQLQALYKDLIDFHGELLLLMHWSILAYLAMVKILKKHYKRTGLLVRAPQLQNLLEQPFCSTEVTADSIQRAETLIRQLHHRLSNFAGDREVPLLPNGGQRQLSGASAKRAGSPDFLPPAKRRTAVASGEVCDQLKLRIRQQIHGAIGAAAQEELSEDSQDDSFVQGNTESGTTHSSCPETTRSPIRPQLATSLPAPCSPPKATQHPANAPPARNLHSAPATMTAAPQPSGTLPNVGSNGHMSGEGKAAPADPGKAIGDMIAGLQAPDGHTLAGYRKAWVALGTWQELVTKATTPSTVIPTGTPGVAGQPCTTQGSSC